MKNYTPRLLSKYKSKVLIDLQKKLNISNVMRVPKVEKIVLNMGLGNAREDKNTFKQAMNELTIITGQKAIGTKSKKAISNFKIREGDLVGASVTLRKNKMYEFLDRFISVASPRIRDFRGFPSKGFDGRGNYNFGVTEQIAFPEINYDKVNAIRGMNISVITSADNDYEAYELLSLLGFPINEYKINRKKESMEIVVETESKSEEIKDVDIEEQSKSEEDESSAESKLEATEEPVSDKESKPEKTEIDKKD